MPPESLTDLLQQLLQDSQQHVSVGQDDDYTQHSQFMHLAGDIRCKAGSASRARWPAIHGLNVSFSEVHGDARKSAHHAGSTAADLDSHHDVFAGLTQRHRRWHDFLNLSEVDAKMRSRVTVSSFLETRTAGILSHTSPVVDDAAAQQPGTLAQDTSDMSYNPEHGRRFLMAVPIFAGIACAFELFKGRIAETDLQSPLPAVVTNAKQETQIFSSQSVWRVLAPYVQGSTGMKCVGYGVAHALLLGIGLYVDFVLTQWNGVFWSSLQSKASLKFYQLLWDFAIITALSVGIGIYSEYIDGMWHLHARDHLTRYFRGIWLKDGTMCKMQQADADEQVDNPDQRIEEDVDEFVSSSRELIFGGLGAVAVLSVYGPMLLRMAPIQLIVFVLIWPAFGALMTHFLGRGLIPLCAAGQSATADFRSELVYVRDNADSLAITRAGPQLEQTLQGRFEVLKRVIYAQLNVTRILSFFKMLFSEYGAVIPLLAVAPSYFDGRIDLGTLMQLRIIVSRVSDSLSFPVGAYEQAVGWAAATNRLVFLQKQAEASMEDATLPIIVGGDRVLAENVSVLTPEGRCVIDKFELHVEAGERVLVLGDAGSGKSLLVRTLAGLWSHMSGRIQVPEDCMFIQGFSFPAMSLRRLLLYPRDTMIDVEPALRAVGAKSLCRDPEDVDMIRHWEDVLSREEQERVQFARLLLQKPRFAILDEPLASLDREEANSLLRLLPESSAVVIFSRRPHASFRVLELQDQASEPYDSETLGLGAVAASQTAHDRPSAGMQRAHVLSGTGRQSSQPSQRGRTSQRGQALQRND